MPPGAELITEQSISKFCFGAETPRVLRRAESASGRKLRDARSCVPLHRDELLAMSSFSGCARKEISRERRRGRATSNDLAAAAVFPRAASGIYDANVNARGSCRRRRAAARSRNTGGNFVSRALSDT